MYIGSLVFSQTHPHVSAAVTTGTSQDRQILHACDKGLLRTWINTDSLGHETSWLYIQVSICGAEGEVIHDILDIGHPTQYMDVEWTLVPWLAE